MRPSQYNDRYESSLVIVHCTTRLLRLLLEVAIAWLQEHHKEHMCEPEDEEVFCKCCLLDVMHRRVAYLCMKCGQQCHESRGDTS